MDIPGELEAADLARASCAYFARETLRGPAEAPYNGKFLIGPHHVEWDRMLARSARICLMAPRDHGKTFYWDFAYPIWKAAHQPNGRGYIFSASQDQASRILRDIKDEIEDNPKLQWLMPKERDLWNVTSVKLSNGHTINARGYGTKIRGAHPGWIVVDDGLNDEDAYSEVVRQKHIDYFYNAISNMVTPNGQIIVVGTPFHALDLYGDLERNPRYVFQRFPALNAQNQPLWPARYNAQRLNEKRQEIGSVRFTREFLCQPISDDMSMFPGHLFRGAPTEQYQVKLGMPAAYWDSVGVTRRFIGVDLALSSSTAADYTVIFVMGLDSHGNRWVLDIIRSRGQAFQQQLSAIHAAGKKYDPDLIYIEANQMQRVFGDELLRTSDLPIKKFVTTGRGGKGPQHPGGNTTSANKNSLEGGVPALRVLLENRKFRIPRGDARSVEVTDQWISEMQSFTWLDGKLQGVGAHDDVVMSCWLADQALRAGGFSFATGNEGPPQSVDEVIRQQMQDTPSTPEPEPAASAAQGKPDLLGLLSVGIGAPGEEEPEHAPSLMPTEAHNPSLAVDLQRLFPGRT